MIFGRQLKLMNDNAAKQYAAIRIKELSLHYQVLQWLASIKFHLRARKKRSKFQRNTDGWNSYTGIQRIKDGATPKK